MKHVLMIAFHFPPFAVSSGVQRTLRFTRYLAEFGWQPTVLTANPRAYQKCSDDQLAEIPDDVDVIRTPAWDTSRHLSAGGRYPGFLARPDRWVTWWLGTLPAARGIVRRHRPDAIWSTYPIATAHLVGSTLSSGGSLPWIADFRDPMAQPDYPTDPKVWRSFDRIERKTIEQACFSTFTTPSAVSIYQERYPARADHISLLENGYDEESFAGAVAGSALNPGRVTLLHSGIVYPSERDPSRLFEALAELKRAAPAIYAKVIVRFRAPVHDDLLHGLAQQHAVQNAIQVLPSVPYRDALQEMLSADGLLILQASNCNAQIPAKFYEYLRAGRPIVILTDPQGDTAAVARNAGIEAIAALNDSAAIAEQIARFVDRPSTGTMPRADVVSETSRRRRAAQLAQLLDRATA